MKNHLVSGPATNKVRRNRTEELGKDFAVFPRSLFQEVVRFVRKRVRDEAIFTGLSLIRVRIRRRAHEGRDLRGPTVTILGRNKSEMFCVEV